MKRPVPYLVFTWIILSCSPLCTRAHATVCFTKENKGVSGTREYSSIVTSSDFLLFLNIPGQEWSGSDCMDLQLDSPLRLTPSASEVPYLFSKEGGSLTGTSSLADNGDFTGEDNGNSRIPDAPGNALVDNTPPVVWGVDVPSGVVKGAGINLDFGVYMSEATVVNTSGGTPYLDVTLDIGGTVHASYLSGTGTQYLTFRYAIVAGNFDDNGIDLGNVVITNGGTLQDAAGNNANLTLTNVGNTASIRVDAIAPRIISVSVPAAKTYKEYEWLEFTVNYDKRVNIPGTPYLDLTLDTGGTVQATYDFGNSTYTQIVFSYQVVAGNLDVTGISLGASIIANGSTVKDVAGNNANLTLNNVGSTANVQVDAVAPTVTSVGAPSDGPYKAGANLDFTVNMSEATYMRTGGSAFLIVTLDTGGEIHPVYLSGSGTTVLTFRYTLVPGLQDLTGITVGSSISTNSGDLKDATGNYAVTGLNNVEGTSNVLVDAIAPVISSVSAPANGSYKEGANLDFTVNMSETTTVDCTAGTPYINVIMESATVHAEYLSGSGTSALTFRYTVVSGDKARYGIGIGAGTYLEANGGLMRDIAGNSAYLYLNGGWFSNVLVDTTVPTVLSVYWPDSKTYKKGANLDFTVSLSKNTIVSGIPYLEVTMDTGGTVQASYLSGSGTSSFIFRYTVAAGNLDLTGIDVGSSIILNGGSLTDAAGHNAVVTISNNNAYSSTVYVDAVGPVVTSVEVPADSTYSEGQTLWFNVHFNEPAIASVNGGWPYFEVTFDTGGTVQARYESRSGSVLTFKYRILSGYLDTNGIVVGTSIVLNGGNIYDNYSNAASLALTNIGSTANVKVDALAPTVSSVSVPANGTYVAGQNLDFTVNMSEATTLDLTGGTPYLGVTLDTGGTVQAAYLSGSGTSALVFRYTVVSGNRDQTGIAVVSPLVHNGGTLKDVVGNFADLTLNSVGSTANVKVDAVAPTVSSVSVPANGTYVAGQNLDFTVRMSEATTIDLTGGAPFLNVTLDTGGTVLAAYLSGSGSTSLVFRYTVVSGNLDQTGITVVSPLVLNGCTLKDAAGNNAVLTLNSVGSTANVKVDAVAPIVSSVSVPANGTYCTGQNLNFAVAFDEAVYVTGTPYLSVTLDTGGTVQAAYLSGSGSTSLVFRYTVVSSNLDQTGVTLGGAITANGGTLKDAAGNNANLTLNAVGSTANLLVDGVAPTVSSVSVPADGTYITGQNLDFTVNMNEATIVDASSSSWVPTIDISFDSGSTAPASYFSGSGTSSLVFRYTVQSGKMDLTGISLSNTMYKDTWTTIKDAAGNNAVLTLNSVSSTSSVLVEAVAPTVNSVEVPSNGTYVAGQNLDFTINFNEATIVNTTGGTPYLGITLDQGGSVHANYLGGSGTTALSFRYTVVAGNLDESWGVEVGTLAANGCTLKDAAGNNAVLTLNNVANTWGVKVDAASPEVDSVAVPSDGTYAAGQNLDFTVNFDEVTYVSGGTPYLNVTLDTGGTVHASYLEGSGTSVLSFRYTVVAGNADTDGITLGAAISPNGATIRDAAGNNAAFTLNSVASTANVLVDGVAPVVSSVSSSSANGTYKIGDVIPVTVIFPEAVVVTGTPALALNSGGSASYSSGSGTSTLTFSYTVGSGHSSSDLDYAATGSLSLSGGTIKDLPGNDATLTLPATGGAGSLGGQKNIVVDGIPPAITSVSSTSANGNYLTGNTLAITMSFSEAVTVTGTPVLALNSGGTANYSSGSGTNVLNFNYTVSAGQSSADLNYSSSSALSLDGATITDVAGNNAILTLPAVGAAGSLGADKNLVIGAVPNVTTQAVANIAATTFTAAGTVTDLGFPNPTAHGVCWSTSPSPTVANTLVNLGAKSSTGTYSTPVTGLSPGTVYYLRAYATNNVGIGYGNEVTFRTQKQLTITDPSTSPKTYDGNTVAAVDQLGTLSGIIGSEEVSVIPEAAFDNKNSGTGKTVTVSYTLSGADKDKYLAPVNSEVYTGIIRPKSIAIVPQDGLSKTYGDPDPDFSFSYSPSMLQGDFMTGSLSRKTGENAGIYELTLGSVSAGTNYTVNMSSPVTLTIRKAPLTIRADAKTKSFGTENPPLTCQYSGWKYSDNEAVLRTKPLISTMVTGAASVGEYPDAISVSGAIGDNYDITCIPANFSVVRALLTVTANQVSKIYGAPNPPLSFVYSGWVNTDDESVLSKKPVASTMIADMAAAGNYPGAITVSGGEDKNYSFTYVSSDVQVTPKQVVPSVTARSRCYDATAVATLSSQVVSGVITPDDVSLVVGNTSFSDPSPGHDKMVTAENLSLAGAKAANYILSLTSAVTKADIFGIPLSKVAGPEQVCAGVNPCVYSIDSSMASCQWAVSQGGVIISGQGTSSISVDWTTSGPQIISVNYSNANGCAANTSAAMNVMVNAIPPDPVITASGTALISDAPQGNQWYFSSTKTGAGNAVQGAISPSFTPSMDGWYWTQVTLADCSSGLSNKLYRINPAGKNQYNLYPVPNHGEFTISIVTPFEEEVTVYICDQMGNKIYELTGLILNGEYKKIINLRQAQSGIYTFVVISKEGKVARKFTVIR